MHEEGLIDRILDVQSFDLDAAKSLKNNHFHHQISASYYASHMVAAAVDQLDFVILSALEIDTDFNVNVLTGLRRRHPRAPSAAIPTRRRVPASPWWWLP